MVSFKLPPGTTLTNTINRLAIPIKLTKKRKVNAIVYTKIFFSTEKINFMGLVNLLKYLIK